MKAMNEYDELFKRVKKYFQCEQVQIVLLDPITTNISFVELRGWYKDFKNEIENE